MNRYVIQGITEDLRAGKRVAVLSPNPTKNRLTFNEMLSALDEREIERVRRANGDEEIHHVSGGSLKFPGGPSRIHPAAFDVLVIPDWNHLNESARSRILYDAHEARRMELIRL